jgi:glucuronosyltransferase
MESSRYDYKQNIKLIFIEEQHKFLPADLPSSFLVEKWVSQLTLLAHEKVQLFISHCGANGAHESLLLGKPLICIPHHADQFDIALRVEENGAGHQFNKNYFTHEEVTTKATKILRDPSYRTNALKLQKILKSAGGAKKAADLVEMHLTVGIDHLKESYDPYPQPVDLFLLVWILVPVYSVWWICKKLCCGRKPRSSPPAKLHQN